jgi:RNA polymerase sigma factor (TIGR02999 family)
MGSMTDAQPPRDVTGLLRDWRAGDPSALEQLLPLVYGQLHTIAAGYLSRESKGHTLQVTALVNEAFIRLVGQNRTHWQNRSHFLGIAASLMRRILVDHARRSHRTKRGGSAPRVSLDDTAGQVADTSQPLHPLDVFALDRALQKLELLDPRQGRIVELRFFGGLSVEETAEALHVSGETVMRDWRLAKVWLLREMGGHA